MPLMIVYVGRWSLPKLDTSVNHDAAVSREADIMVTSKALDVFPRINVALPVFKMRNPALLATFRRRVPLDDVFLLPQAG